jgi:hypothetical protein
MELQEKLLPQIFNSLSFDDGFLIDQFFLILHSSLNFEPFLLRMNQKYIANRLLLKILKIFLKFKLDEKIVKII